MGKRQKKLHNILNHAFSADNTSLINKTIFYQSEFHNEIFKIYKALDGCLEIYPVNFGDFDVIISDFFIELDEEAHFNRYRSITLDSSIYNRLYKFPLAEYKKYCFENEDRCIKEAGWGNFWTSRTSEKQFGVSDTQKEFNGKGSSRWKQRAFYDYLKDVLAALGKIQLARISVYDMIGINTVNKILKKEVVFNTEELKKLLLNRISNMPRF